MSKRWPLSQSEEITLIIAGESYLGTRKYCWCKPEEECFAHRLQKILQKLSPQKVSWTPKEHLGTKQELAEGRAP